ncbi:hypothetical protein C8A05DRAFT_37555, partial [Staphylotrichum tortipilum]
MTQLVADAELRSELPPLRVTPADLPASDAATPTIAELMAAFALSQFAEALEYRIMSSRPNLPFDRTTILVWYQSPPDDPENMPGFCLRIRRAIHRLLILGAASAGAYNEPIVTARITAPAKKLRNPATTARGGTD